MIHNNNNFCPYILQKFEDKLRRPGQSICVIYGRYPGGNTARVYSYNELFTFFTTINLNLEQIGVDGLT